MDRDTIHEKPPISFLFFFSGFPLVDSFLESTHGLLSVVQDEVHGFWLDSITHHKSCLVLRLYSGRQLDVSLPYIENCSSPLVLIVAVLLPSTSKLIIFLTSARFRTFCCVGDGQTKPIITPHEQPKRNLGSPRKSFSFPCTH